MTVPGRPPALARALLERALPLEAREDVVADLDELYRRRMQPGGVGRARWWYRGQALSFALRFSWERLREHTFERIRMKPRMSVLDWKLGARMLVRYPGLSLIGGLALTAAITIGVVWFEVVREQLDPRIPLDDGDRIVRVENWDASASAPEPRILHDFLVWREQVRTIEHLGAARLVERNLIAPEVRPRPIQVAELSASAFPVTRVQPLLGRALVEGDEQSGAEDVVVLGYDIWRSRFNADPGIVGRAIQVGRTTATVVGVMPDGFGFPRNQQAWVPLRVESVEPREGPPVMVFGRLAEGATMELAQAELTAAGQRMAAARPETHERLVPRVAGLGERTGGSLSLMVVLSQLGVLLILGGISANVATLVFARTAMRESEIVVRSAIGASRGRIIGQLFVESLVMALAAAALGLLAATAIIKFMWHQAVHVRQVPQAFWRNDHLEPATIAYAAGLAVVGATLVALLPALKATGPQVRAGLARMSSGGSNMRFGGVWSVIIVFQVAFTVICLPIGIGVTAETRNDYEVRGSFASGQQYLTFRAEMDQEGIDDADDPAYRARLAAVYDELEQRLLAEPGVTAVTFADRLPGTSGPLRRMEAQRGSGEPFAIQANRDGVVQPVSVAPDLFETFQVPVVAGRGLSAGDVGARTVVVNESLAGNIGGNALGTWIRNAASRDQEAGPWYEVVGVVQNMNVEPTGAGEADFVFHAASPAGATGTDTEDPVSRLTAPYLAVRMAGDPMTLAPRVPEIALAVDPGLRIYETLTLQEVIRRRLLPTLMSALGATIAVGLAVILSAAGLFALMSVSVARRSREIGIRAALGAGRAGVLKAVFARSAAQLGSGILLGNLLVLGILALLGSDVGVDTIGALLMVSALMVLVGVAASAVPARRALQVQPTEVLREAV